MTNEQHSLENISFKLELLADEQKKQGRKIDEIQTKVSDLPCKEHVYRFKGIDVLKNVVIGSLMTFFVLLISAGIAWGDLRQKVYANTEQIESIKEKYGKTN
jgi:hypothetical protein